MTGRIEPDAHRRVGFFHGLMAVFRGLAHAAGLVTEAVGWVVAFVTRRGKPSPGPE